MTAKDLISSNIPVLQPNESISQALMIMEDNGMKHLPVVEEGRYLGLVASDDLQDAPDDRQPVISLQEHWAIPVILDNDHFLKAAQKVQEQNITVVPVLDENRNYAGAIGAPDLLRALTGFVGSDDPGGIIVLETDKRNFSFSELSRLIETNDATITQLNTDEQPETGHTIITIKISKTEISDIIASLQRYEYNVVYYHGEEAYENELRSNYDNLMNYLSI
jgi:acetoin utilization protein AcuB